MRAKSSSKVGLRSKQMTNTAVYLGLFVVLFVFVWTGYKSPNTNGETNLSANQALIADYDINTSTPVVTADEARTANLAAVAAEASGLSSASSVLDKSVSMEILASLNQPNVETVVKPQIVDPQATLEPIVSYVAQNGDNVATIAAKYGVSDQTVRWANNLSGDAVSEGANLSIPTIDGVVYTMKEGDNLADVVSKYRSNLEEVIAVNDLTDENVAPDSRILLPNGDLPETERPGYVAPSSSISRSGSYDRSGSVGSGSGYQFVSAYGGGGFTPGQCTWYAYNRRGQLGLRQPNWRGNANVWNIQAGRSGWSVSNIPSVGAIFQTPRGWAGHVGIVESINPDGTITISEMNFIGPYRTNTRVIPNPRDYNYMH